MRPPASSWPVSRPVRPGPLARWVTGAGVLALHGLALAWVWQAGVPSSDLGGVAARLAARAQPAAAALVYVQPAAAPAAPPAGATPSPPAPVAPPAAAALPAPPPVVQEAPVATGVQVAPTFARLHAPAGPTAGPALPSLEPPSVPGLTASEALRNAAPSGAVLPRAALAGTAPGPSRAPYPLPGNPEPPYPEAAREDGLEGLVALSVTLDEHGRVQSVQWARRSGHALLDRAARDAVRAWRFAPALRDGLAVPGVLTLSIRFQLTAPPALSVADAGAPAR